MNGSRRLMRSAQLAPLLALLAFSGLASASTVFPGALKRNLGLTKAPQCTVCHASLAGGTGTAITPFATAARARGLAGQSDIDKLQEVLAQLEADGLDSDADGIPDIAELKAGDDPNPPRATAVAKPKEQAPKERTGGTVDVASIALLGGAVVLGLLLALGVFVVLRRKK